MFIRWILPGIAIAGFLVAVRVVIAGSKPVLPTPPVAAPSSSPYERFVAGVGIVEPNSENIAIGSHLSGVVMEVYVAAGQKVTAGDPLFKLDDRQHLADLAEAQAALEVTRAIAADAQNELALRERIKDKRAISIDELNRKRYAYQIAQGRVKQAEAQLQEAHTTLERLTVRAPIDATVLQRRLRKGEFVVAGAGQDPYLILGALSPLFLRTDVDENDSWKVAPEARAEAFLRGNASLRSSLEFVRFEPYVVPKRSLTGESTERVDTRVLQVIYKITDSNLPIFVGQIMDVYIEGR